MQFESIPDVYRIEQEHSNPPIETVTPTLPQPLTDKHNSQLTIQQPSTSKIPWRG